MNYNTLFINNCNIMIIITFGWLILFTTLYYIYIIKNKKQKDT